MHLGTALVCGYKILDMVQAGFDFTILLADWHAWINRKLNDDFESIRLCGRYFIECFSAIGISSEKVHYFWTSDLVKNPEYWRTVLEVAKETSVPRISRTLPIMGREADLKEFDAAAMIYPCMQVADMYALEIDCACAGIDQRKAHILAREIAPKLNKTKPVSLHTHLLLGLRGSQAKMGQLFDEDEGINLQIGAKMSKSIPNSTVNIHDEPDEIRKKFRNAFCPPAQAKGNPVLEVAKYVIFGKMGSITIEREAKHGGELIFNSYSDLEDAYSKGLLHPLDLKNGVAEAVIHILEPVRKYFGVSSEILERLRQFEITR